VKVSFADFNLREDVVIIKTDALFKHHAMATHRNREGKSAGVLRYYVELFSRPCCFFQSYDVSNVKIQGNISVN
jgi:hypothetical protein